MSITAAKTVSILAGAAALFLSATAGHAANLIVNGDFEDATVMTDRDAVGFVGLTPNPDIVFDGLIYEIGGFDWGQDLDKPEGGPTGAGGSRGYGQAAVFPDTGICCDVDNFARLPVLQNGRFRNAREVMTQRVSLNAGDYLFTADAKRSTISTDDAKFVLALRDPVDGSVLDHFISDVLSTESWAPVSFRFSITADQAGAIDLAFASAGDGASAEARTGFDFVAFDNLSLVSAPVPAPGLAGLLAAAVMVSRTMRRRHWHS